MARKSMKLYFTKTSPFVRKVLVAARELGVHERLELVSLRPSPLEHHRELARTNPLSKIPALELDDGQSLFDSRVICEYLDALHSGQPLFPEQPAERFRALRVQALSDGILDAGILVFYERAHRPADMQWRPWLEGQSAKVLAGLDALELEARSFSTAFDIGQISAAVAIGWLEFRAVLGDVRQGRPALSAWYDDVRRRPSMSATEPEA